MSSLGIYYNAKRYLPCKLPKTSSCTAVPKKKTASNAIEFIVFPRAKQLIIEKRAWIVHLWRKWIYKAHYATIDWENAIFSSIQWKYGAIAPFYANRQTWKWKMMNLLRNPDARKLNIMSKKGICICRVAFVMLKWSLWTILSLVPSLKNKTVRRLLYLPLVSPFAFASPFAATFLLLSSLPWSYTASLIAISSCNHWRFLTKTPRKYLKQTLGSIIDWNQIRNVNGKVIKKTHNFNSEWIRGLNSFQWDLDNLFNNQMYNMLSDEFKRRTKNAAAKQSLIQVDLELFARMTLK